MSLADFLWLCAEPDQEKALALLDQHLDWLEKGLRVLAYVNDRYVWPGSTAIIAAAMGGSVGLIEALLKRGADVRKVDRFGWNALMKASWLDPSPLGCLHWPHKYRATSRQSRCSDRCS